MKPNGNFNLDVEDVKIIEDALLYQQGNLLNDSERMAISVVLAKLFDQKNFYRPKSEEPYVSG